MELQCVRKSIRWCGRSLLAFQICGTSKECRATCLKPYCAIQIAGPLARAPAEMLPGTKYTQAWSKAPGPCRGSSEHLVKPAGAAMLVGLRCWWWCWRWWQQQQRRRRPDLKSQISNPNPAKQLAEVLLLLLLLFLPPLWVCVSAARKGGLQTIQAENSKLGVDCCTCWFCLQLCWKQDELVTYYSGGIGQKSTNALPSGQKCCSGLGRCHTHTQTHTKYTHTQAQTRSNQGDEAKV